MVTAPAGAATASDASAESSAARPRVCADTTFAKPTLISWSTQATLCPPGQEHQANIGIISPLGGGLAENAKSAVVRANGPKLRLCQSGLSV